MGLCKGGCGNKAIYKGWCGVRWKRGNRVSVICPKIEKKRAEAISEYRLKEARLGLNPMQNQEICNKNHSIERNRKASESLKKLGEAKLLPQQTESKYLKEKRRRNVSKTLRELSKERKLWFQKPEFEDKVKERNIKIAETLRKLAKEGKLAILAQSPEKRKLIGKRLAKWWTPEKRKEHNKKLSEIMKEKVKLGLINPPKAKKFIFERNGVKMVLRSGWEREVAQFLDENNFDWKYEPFFIEFKESQTNENHFTLPDFFIPNLRTIIEVKSDKEFNSQKTIDKIKGMKEFGFNVILMGRKEIEQIRKNEVGNLLSKITGVINA